MAATSNAYIFSTLEKFSDGNGAELNSFLAKFERCCVIGNKVDADGNPVKGQLLMLFVEGRASAILEEYEQTAGGNQLTYAELSQKLKDHFDSAETRENSMAMFESRIQKVNETEEEFMLDLLKLYQTANPDHAAAVTLLAVKRKFLGGISPTLKTNMYVFCSNPLDANVTREQLLTHCRKARNMMVAQGSEAGASGYATDKVLVHSSRHNGGNEDALTAAINNLVLQVQDHVANTDKRFEDVGEAIAAVSGQRNNFRYRGRGNNRRGRGTYNNNGPRDGYISRGNYNNNGSRDGYMSNNRGNFNSNSRRGRGGNNRGGMNNHNNNANNVITCHKCGGPNHYSRACTQNGSGN